MAAEESELQFIRCPGCRSLVPAVATRCRMCGQLLEPRKRDAVDPLNKKSRVRQRTMSVSEDERESIRDQVVTGDFVDEAEADFPEEDYPVEAEPFEELPPEVRAFADRSDDSELEPVDETPIFHQPAPNAPLPREEADEAGWAAADEATFDDEEDDEDTEEESVDLLDPVSPQPGKKKRRRRRKKKGGQLGTSEQAPSTQLLASPASVERTPMNEPRERADHGMPWSRPEQRMTPPPVEQPRRELRHPEPITPRVEPRTQPQRPAPRPSEPIEAGAGELVGWLVYHGSNGDLVSREIRGGQFFVSRERLRAQDIVFEHASVSRPQCLLFAHEVHGVTIQDTMSEHGTFVRRFDSDHFEEGQGQFAVGHGDTLRFGELEVLVCLLPRHS